MDGTFCRNIRYILSNYWKQNGVFFQVIIDTFVIEHNRIRITIKSKICNILPTSHCEERSDEAIYTTMNLMLTLNNPRCVASREQSSYQRLKMQQLRVIIFLLNF